MRSRNAWVEARGRLVEEQRALRCSYVLVPDLCEHPLFAMASITSSASSVRPCLTRPGQSDFCEEVVNQIDRHELASGSNGPSNIVNLPRAFGHSADTRILQLGIRGIKYLILLVGAQGLEPWTR
jgi:hypothetical protein